jgi:hypothetical protein
MAPSFTCRTLEVGIRDLARLFDKTEDRILG